MAAALDVEIVDVEGSESSGAISVEAKVLAAHRPAPQLGCSRSVRSGDTQASKQSAVPSRVVVPPSKVRLSPLKVPAVAK